MKLRGQWRDDFQPSTNPVSSEIRRNVDSVTFLYSGGAEINLLIKNLTVGNAMMKFKCGVIIN